MAPSAALLKWLFSRPPPSLLRNGRKRSFLDLPVDIKKRILACNSDEQMIWPYINSWDCTAVMTIGLDTSTKNEIAPRSLWNLAQVNSQLFNELLPFVTNPFSKKPQRNIKQRLLCESIVNISWFPEFHDVAYLLQQLNIDKYLFTLRIWMHPVDAAWKLFSIEECPESAAFLEIAQDKWPMLSHIELLPMRLPLPDDPARGEGLLEEYECEWEDLLLEEVRKADAMPCMAERMWDNGTIWRSYQCTSTTYLPETDELPAGNDIYGSEASDIDERDRIAEHVPPNEEYDANMELGQPIKHVLAGGSWKSESAYHSWIANKQDDEAGDRSEATSNTQRYSGGTETTLELEEEFDNVWETGTDVNNDEEGQDSNDDMGWESEDEYESDNSSGRDAESEDRGWLPQPETNTAADESQSLRDGDIEIASIRRRNLGQGRVQRRRGSW